MAVGLGSEAPYYLELEAPFSGGPPVVVLTIYNVAGSQKVRVERTAGGETGVVAGARSLRITEATVLRDWAAPLNRPVTYTVYADGEAQSSSTITVNSDTAWLQDPLNPTGGIPVEWKKLRPGALLLDSDAIHVASYANAGTSVRVMGSKYPRFYSGERQAASGVQLSMYSDDEPTESALRQLVADAPVVLFRPLPEFRMLPPVCYLAAEASEDQRTVRLGGDLVKWLLTGDLVQAVLQAAVTGFITYDDVQALLGGYTYDEVQAAAASTVYLDWLKNPLIFSNL